MSINLPSRPLTRSAASLLRISLPKPRRYTAPLIPRRTLFNFFRGKTDRPPILDPLATDFKKKSGRTTLPKPPRTGDLASSSIFNDGSPQHSTPGKPAAPGAPSQPIRRNPSLMAAALDPNPRARRRWERKMVIRTIRHKGRINKSMLIARTEREYLLKSPFLKTSIKKLGPLARQIAGKPVEDAIVQMRFSKKKAARDVLEHLQLARDEAVVARGMGLGMVGEDGEAEGKKVQYRDKKGKVRTVGDKTAMYVDQAWVGRGSYGIELDYRARGQVNYMKPPHTSISILLKEEATRIRLAKEREEKKAKKEPWVQHPDRPITRQTQYALW